jgi:RNA polymerase sigma-70 factor (ECF subfamily)
MVDHASSAQLSRLVADHHAALYRYAYRLSGSAADAEDLTQQAFLTAAAKGDQVRSAEGVRPWLYAVLRNTWLKSRRKRGPVVAGDLDLALDSIPEELPETPLVDQEELQAALDGLPEEFKVVVLMFYYEHSSYKEIAEQLGLPIGTVMSRLSRAKSHLRARLFPDESGGELLPQKKQRPARVN